MDAAAVQTRDPATGGGSTLGAELVVRAAAIARGQHGKERRTALLPRDLRAALHECEARARRLPDDLGQAAALDFLGDAVATVAVRHRLEPGEARAAVVAAADALGVPGDTAAFAVFRRALASKECIQLPPATAAELALALLVELAPAAAASLWVLDENGATSCLAGQGRAPRSRGLRDVARAALDGVVGDAGQIGVRLVDRWDRPYAALVARVRSGDAARLDDYLAEAATALAPMLERAANIDRRLERERDAVAAGDRRLVRLGFDLHDGPLQEIVALADELRRAAGQIDGIVSEEDRPRVRGRFHDLDARLGSLDESLRQIARATHSTAAVARPVAEALESELQTLERATGIVTELDVAGELHDLTDSQKIVLFRVVQEALSNVRKHSRARKVSVVLRSTRTFLDLTVSDDGRGFEPGRAGARLGLTGIAERVRLLGGVVEIESRPGAGARVRATLPQWRPTSRSVATLSATGS